MLTRALWCLLVGHRWRVRAIFGQGVALGACERCGRFAVAP